MTQEYEEDHLSKEEFFKLNVGDQLQCIGKPRDYASWKFPSNSVQTGDIIKITRKYDASSIGIKAYNFHAVKARYLLEAYSYYIPKDSERSGYPKPWELLDSYQLINP